MKKYLQTIWSENPIAVAIAGVILSFVIGYILNSGAPEQQKSQQIDAAAQAADSGKTTGSRIYVCPTMCIRPLTKPGSCPICGMELLLVSGGDPGDQPATARLKLSEQAAKLADIQVAPVERKTIAAEIRAFGQIEYDPSQITYVNAFMPGVINKIYIERAGVGIRYGEPLFDIYSSDLYFTQQELLEVIKYVPSFLVFQTGTPHIARKAEVQGRETPQNSKQGAAVKEAALQKLNSIRKKLALLGLAKKDIDEIMKKGEPTGIATVYAPLGGTIVEKKAYEGAFVNTGTPLFAIANPRYMWIKLDVYESDYAWIKNGQEIEFQTEAYPGEIFRGRVAFVDPIFNKQTRTFKVGAIFPDTGGKLRADMTVRATIKAVITADTTAAAAGRAAIKQAPLVIPVTAPLITGKRAVVYVAVPEVKGTYEGREIILGPRTKDYYVVWGGVKEGDQVVVNGNFKIDSAMQILAKPSMINSIAHDQIQMQFPAAPPAMETPANTVTEKIEEGHYIRKGYPATLPQMGVETTSPAPSQKPDRPLPQRPVPPAR